MKYLLFISGLLLSDIANAQWNTSAPPNIYFNTGNVGIGTSSPATSLHIFQGASPAARSTYSKITVESNNHSQIDVLSGDSKESAIYFKTTFAASGATYGGLAYFHESTSNYGLRLYAGSSIKMSVLDNGNVGIGVITPIAKLDVRGATNFQGGRLTQQGDIPNDNNTVLVNTSTLGYGLYSKGGLSNRYTFHFENQAGSSILYGRGDGNIGIGTTTPQSKLDVVGNANFQGAIDIAGGANFNGGRLSVNANLLNDNSAVFYNASDNGYGIFSQGGGSGKYAFHFLNKYGQTVLYGSGNGNIGIGTIYPNQKLTVNGTIYGKEVLIDLNVPGPDYVFEPTYALPTLAEIESYIKANKHLPEVPSAKEMEANGINLSEMNMILLKKVEELTLYMIELKKENELIKSELLKKADKEK